MKNIFKLILRYHFILIFLLLEFICFSLIVKHNNYQRTIFLKNISSVFFYTSEKVNQLGAYFKLEEENEKLIAENIKLKNLIYTFQSDREEEIDTLVFENDLHVHPAKIVNTSFNKTKNHMVINKGSSQGISPEMAVSSAEGIVGLIKNTSEHYSVVLPLININLRVSAKIKKNGYYGSLQWDGQDYRYSLLKEIPFHVNVEQGDTIVTSGFTSIFPEGEIIGFVESVDRETANFLTIKVKLATDFKKISDVYIIENINKEERLLLEKEGFEE